jgi:glycine/serine hydroxymethyltransferase
MGEGEMREIGALICRLIDEGEAAVPTVRAQVLDLCARFPLYPDLHM